VTQFQHLERIVLIHGRFSYMRIAYACMYILYKNIAFCLAFALFAVYSGFSGQLMYDSNVLAFYNVVFTAGPVVMFGFFERDIEVGAALKYPMVYKAGQTDDFMNLPVFTFWTLEAIWNAIITFYFCFNIIGYRQQGNGQDFSMWDAGNACFTCILLVVTFRLCLDTRSFTVPHHIMYWGSVALWFLFIIPYTWIWLPSMISSDQYYSFPTLLENFLFYATVPVTVFVCLLPTYITYAYQTIFRKHEYTEADHERLKEKEAKRAQMPEWRKQVDNVFTLEPDSYSSVVYRLRREGAGGRNACLCTDGIDFTANDKIMEDLDVARTTSTNESISNASGVYRRATVNATADGIRQTKAKKNNRTRDVN